MSLIYHVVARWEDKKASCRPMIINYVTYDPNRTRKTLATLNVLYFKARGHTERNTLIILCVWVAWVNLTQHSYMSNSHVIIPYKVIQ